MLRFEVERAARSWIGTPFRHQQRVKNAGVDCVGLINGVGIECGVLDYTDEKWAPFRGYSRRPGPEQLQRYCEMFLVPLQISHREKPPVASIGLVEWRPGLTLHFVIASRLPDGRRSIIHATEALKRVVEHGFVGEWPSLINSWWAYPGVED